MSVTLYWSVDLTATFDVYSDMGTGFGVPILKRYAQTQGLAEGAYDDDGLQPGTAYEYAIVERPPDSKNPVEPRRAWVGVTTLGTAARPRLALRIPAGRTSVTAASLPDGPVAAVGTPTTAPATMPPRPDTLLLSLMDTTDYVDDLGNVVIVGEIRNDSPYNAAGAEVVVTFYDARGEIILQEQTQPLLSLLPSQEKSPFVLSVPQPPNLWDWSLRATARPTDKLSTPGLVVTQSRGREDGVGFYHVTGKVLNKGTRKAHLAQVIVTLYDREGDPISAGFTYTEPYTIDMGEEGAFDCAFSYYPRVKNYNIQIEWD